MLNVPQGAILKLVGRSGSVSRGTMIIPMIPSKVSLVDIIIPFSIIACLISMDVSIEDVSRNSGSLGKGGNGKGEDKDGKQDEGGMHSVQMECEKSPVDERSEGRRGEGKVVVDTELFS